ncbi:MAG: MFS transporter [Candidatus Paceibacterota bacterium]|jgi:predicted MFS family arabinose efflux permease
MSGLKINPVVRILVWSDLVFWTGWGLIGPVFAIFILQNIEGGSIAVVGFATAVYWIVKSILRIPIGLFLDSFKGEKDDYWFMTGGLFIAALIPFGYVYAFLPWHLYLLEAVHALAMAMSLSGWAAIFSRHLDKGKEATEFGLDATAVGLGTGISGALGGLALTYFSFQQVFVVTGFLGLLGALLLLLLREGIETSIRPFHFGPMRKIKAIFYREAQEKQEK